MPRTIHYIQVASELAVNYSVKHLVDYIFTEPWDNPAFHSVAAAPPTFDDRLGRKDKRLKKLNSESGAKDLLKLHDALTNVTKLSMLSLL